MRRWSASCAVSLGVLTTGQAGAFEVETLRDAGPVDKRFNLAVLGDGYRAEDQAKLKTDAQGIIGYLFGVTPLKEYAAFINVKLVHVISNQDGADNGSLGAERDTALDSYFNCGGIDRLLCVDGGKAATIAAEDVPEYNFAVVIVNDTKYGGSGGSICASSANSESFEVMAHEIGHSLARLADEYDYEGNQPPCDEQQDCREANVTLRTQRDQIKWRDWILDATPVPTPKTDQYGSLVGLFEGARYQATGAYRPQLNCKMKDLGQEYCAVCTEQFVRSFWSMDNIQMIEATTPGPSVQVDSCEPIELQVTTPPIVPSTYRYTWSVDGQSVPEATSTLRLTPDVLMQGNHTVNVLVEDVTEMVRSDPEELLEDEYSWSVSVTVSDCPAGMGGAGGAGGVAGGGGVGGAGAAGAPAGAAGIASGGLAGMPLAGAAGLPSSGGTAGSMGGPMVAPAPPPRDSSGCGCALPGEPASRSVAPWSLGALLLLAGRRRRAR
jgi:MYXO-CTERM domain-containing protein